MRLAEIYDAPMLRAFFRRFGEYCVLSRKLGICHSGVVHENYGDHEEKGRDALARLLASQAPAYQDTLLVYWNLSLKRMPRASYKHGRRDV